MRAPTPGVCGQGPPVPAPFFEGPPLTELSQKTAEARSSSDDFMRELPSVALGVCERPLQLPFGLSTTLFVIDGRLRCLFSNTCGIGDVQP